MGSSIYQMHFGTNTTPTRLRWYSSRETALGSKYRDDPDYGIVEDGLYKGKIGELRREREVELDLSYSKET